MEAVPGGSGAARGRAEAAPGHPEVIRIAAPNPGPMTLAGTNTYVVAGHDGTWVIDPGPADSAHIEAIRAAAGAEITGVLLTHSHSDHTAAVEPLGAPLLWGKVSSGDETRGPLPRADAAPPDAATEHGFEVIPTPGHAADHVCFLRGEVCFCGDLILGEGSSIVPPAALGGSLAAYMRSLELVAQLSAELLAPGHGPWITDPPAKIAEYVAHRREREQRLIAALATGERSRAALLAKVWDDVPDVLRPAAAVALAAHLEGLEAEGRLDPRTLNE